MADLVYRDATAKFVVEDDLFVAGWSGPPQAGQMHAMREHGQAIEAERGPIALLNVAFGGVPRFSEEVRKLATEYTRDASLFQRGRAHVVMMSGIAGSTVRLFINTFILLGRPPRPTRLFGTMDAATQWLIEHLGEGAWTPSRIVATADAARP